MWPVLLRNVTDAPSFAHQLQTMFFDHEPKTLHSVLYTNDRMAQETSLDLDHLIQWTRGLLTRPERIKKDRIHTRKVSNQVLTTRKTRSRLVFGAITAIALLDEIANESIQLRSDFQKDRCWKPRLYSLRPWSTTGYAIHMVKAISKSSEMLLTQFYLFKLKRDH